MLFFTTFLKHGGAKLAYWEDQKRARRSKGRKYNKEHIQKPGHKRTSVQFMIFKRHVYDYGSLVCDDHLDLFYV